MVKPRISVIVPTHNSSGYLRDALASLRGQTFDDYEAIVVDSSSDDTPEILKEYEEKDSRIKIVYDQDGSYGHKLNVGIDQAKGEYIAILESDDRLKPDELARFAFLIEKFDRPDYIKGDYSTFQESDSRICEQPIHHYTPDMYDRLVDFQNEREYWMGSWNHIWTGVYRADFLRKNNIRANETPGASYQDTGFSVLCNVYAKRVVFIDDIVYMYRTDNESSSVKSDEKYLLVKEEFEWIYEQLSERNLLSDMNRRSLKEFKINTYKWNMERLSEEYRIKFRDAVIYENEPKIKVSVILPSLNVGVYIRQCIESVMSQTLDGIEILCIDAGSTDGTIEIIQELAELDNRIRLILSDRKSYGYQMNLGIKEARGEFIGIVETDDYIDRQMYSALYKTAKWYDVDVVKSIAYDTYDYGDKGVAEVPVCYIADSGKRGKVIFPDDDPGVHTWDGNIWNGIYRKSFLDRKEISFRETSGAAYQDIGFQQKVLSEVESIVCIPNLFYHYRKIRPGASTLSEKCLDFFYGEYKDLIDNNRIKANRLKAVYARMIPAFFDELDKLLLYSDFDDSMIGRKESIEWFYNRAVYAKENALVTENGIGGWNYLRF